MLKGSGDHDVQLDLIGRVQVTLGGGLTAGMQERLRPVLGGADGSGRSASAGRYGAGVHESDVGESDAGFGLTRGPRAEQMLRIDTRQVVCMTRRRWWSRWQARSMC